MDCRNWPRFFAHRHRDLISQFGLSDIEEFKISLEAPESYQPDIDEPKEGLTDDDEIPELGVFVSPIYNDDSSVESMEEWGVGPNDAKARNNPKEVEDYWGQTEDKFFR